MTPWVFRPMTRIPSTGTRMMIPCRVIIRSPVDGIRVIGRNTQGVRVMNLDAGDLVVDGARVVKEDGDEAEAGAAAGADADDE